MFIIILYDNIFPYVRNIINTAQHGFVTKRLRVTNLCKLPQYIFEELDERSQVETFNQIDHYSLLAKLNYFGN